MVVCDSTWNDKHIEDNVITMSVAEVLRWCSPCLHVVLHVTGKAKAHAEECNAPDAAVAAALVGATATTDVSMGKDAGRTGSSKVVRPHHQNSADHDSWATNGYCNGSSDASDVMSATAVNGHSDHHSKERASKPKRVGGNGAQHRASHGNGVMPHHHEHEALDDDTRAAGKANGHYSSAAAKQMGDANYWLEDLIASAKLNGKGEQGMVMLSAMASTLRVTAM